jgi:hypothetical protein
MTPKLLLEQLRAINDDDDMGQEEAYYEAALALLNYIRHAAGPTIGEQIAIAYHEIDKWYS